MKKFASQFVNKSPLSKLNKKIVGQDTGEIKTDKKGEYVMHGKDTIRPADNKKFWRKKLTRSRKRDIENIAGLKKRGLRILIIWECSFRGAGKKREKEFDVIIIKTVKWLNSKSKYKEIRG